jgi:hypothetical protein
MYDGNYDTVDASVAIKYDSLGMQTQRVENKYDINRHLIEKHVVGMDDATSFSYYYHYDETKLVEVQKIMKVGKTDWK